MTRLLRMQMNDATAFRELLNEHGAAALALARALAPRQSAVDLAHALWRESVVADPDADERVWVLSTTAGLSLPPIEATPQSVRVDARFLGEAAARCALGVAGEAEAETLARLCAEHLDLTPMVEAVAVALQNAAGISGGGELAEQWTEIARLLD